MKVAHALSLLGVSGRTVFSGAAASLAARLPLVSLGSQTTSAPAHIPSEVPGVCCLRGGG